MAEEPIQGLSFASLFKRTGLSQEALATRVGVRQATVSAWVTGQTVPKLTPLQLQSLLTVLNCSLNELVQACHPSQAKENL